MNDNLHLLSQFHFLRPYWLLGVVPALILFALLWRRVAHAGEWQRSISPHLLQHLVQGNQTSDSKTPLKLLLAAWLIASVAMAGPTVQQLPAAMKKKTDARVIVLDLTLSMLCTDTPPSRLVRAKHKLSDILTRSKEGLTGLVVFAGSAHVVSPLTDDTNTILSMAGSLTPDIMPIAGSDPIAAIKKAAEVLKAGGAAQGQVLYIGDEMPDNFADALESLKGNIVLSVLAVGTSEGGPVAVGGGRYLKDNSGSMVLAPVNHERMREAAAFFGGRYSAMTADDSDINLLLTNFLDLDSDVRETQREFDVWDDLGAWVALLILPLAALGYRKGWLGALLLPLLLGVTLTHSPDVQAKDANTPAEENAQAEGPTAPAKSETDSVSTGFWNNGFWKNSDQQGKQAFDAKNWNEAATRFKSDDWKASALYNAGKYQEAEALFGKQKTADAQYNRGNALAQQGKLDEAVKAYDEALKLNPDMADAKANRKTVKKLLKQQKQSQQGNSDKNGKDGKDKDGKDASKNNSQQQKDQDKDQQNQQNGKNDQQNQDSQNQDSQNQNQQDKNQQNQSDQNPSDKNNGQDQSSKKNSSSSDDKQKDDAANDQKQKDKKHQQQNQQQSADEKDQQQAENGDDNQQPNAREMPTSPDDKKPETEDQQAMEQWLRRVPDDPGGLLRRKFYYESRLRRNNENQSNTQW